jgi:hypothetical protein
MSAVAPVLVTVLPARTAKVPVDPRGTATEVAHKQTENATQKSSIANFRIVSPYIAQPTRFTIVRRSRIAINGDVAIR